MRCSGALLLLLTQCSNGARILAVFHTFSVSHFAVFEPLVLQLVARGHDVVLVSGYPLSAPSSQYEHIDIIEAKEKFNGSWSLGSFPEIPTSFRNVLAIIAGQNEENDNIFRLKSVQDLLASGRNIDLVIVEQFTSDVFNSFASKFRAPMIMFSSCPPMPWAVDQFGAPASLAFSPNLFSGYTHNMGFAQRAINALQVLLAKLYQRFVLNRVSEAMSKRYFGDDTPALVETLKNSSLLLVNSHFTFFSPKPLPPQVVEVGGIHVKPSKPVIEDLDRWMNESTDGVVYFSFGSMLRGATLPEDKVRAFVEVFRTLPQRVLWKWEEDAVEGLPDNVKIMKWIPQRDVLAHPKVRVFISHGGLLGTTEAVVSGVPILGIPMYGDQPNNVAALVENKVAIHVDYNNISVASLSYALDTLINDTSFKENAKRLSQRFLDRPQSPLETAVYWTEYVIRHGGAPHLQSAAVHLTWYQYYLLDVIAVCLTALAAALATIFYIIKTSLKLLCSVKPTKLKSS